MKPQETNNGLVGSLIHIPQNTEYLCMRGSPSRIVVEVAPEPYKGVLRRILTLSGQVGIFYELLYKGEYVLVKSDDVCLDSYQEIK